MAGRGGPLVSPRIERGVHLPQILGAGTWRQELHLALPALDDGEGAWHTEIEILSGQYDPVLRGVAQGTRDLLQPEARGHRRRSTYSLTFVMMWSTCESSRSGYKGSVNSRRHTSSQTGVGPRYPRYMS